MAGAPQLDPGDTKQALLEAGKRLFSRNGYEGTSVRALTREAGTNLGAVTYHFTSKRELYEAVLARELGAIVDQVVGAIAEVSDGDPDTRIDTGIRAMFEALLDHPHTPPLMVHDLAAGQDPPEPVLRNLRRMAGTFGEAIAAGQERGIYRPGPPSLMALSVVYQALHFTLVRPFWKPVLGIDPSDATQREQVIRHALDFVHHGLHLPAAGDVS